ncbi:hypothetical protein AGLY_008496 [Aphis glycines]|uniref:DUF4371 domain-containing protein n=1 Tax=Aphis glycines TaxID=307491 RepID=A0A6G0TLF6_APHGL|nr:hypothetical protein AGLY_008496 [Aphis glycines]
MQLGATSDPDDPATVENESLPPAKKVKLLVTDDSIEKNSSCSNFSSMLTASKLNAKNSCPAQSSSHSKYDIGLYINSSKKITDEDKIEILSHIWTQDAKYNFPTVDHGKFKRTFQLKWLDLFQWLTYSNNKNGSFCKFCVLFLNSHHVGKGLNTAVGTLVKDSIIKQLDTKRVKDISVNRAKLKPIIQTIRFCGRQQIALRGHEDWGRITMDEPDKNVGNFRSLLRYRAKSGDVILKEHLETTSSRELYTSPIIQNEMITIFGELIQSHLVNEISKAEFFTVLADETTDIT